MKSVSVLLIFFIFVTSNVFAREKRVNQVPNGNKYSCKTCHTGQGGPRNDFGKAIESGFLDGNGDVIWGPALAALDSDKDGKTNGEELQDPNGLWVAGQTNPGETNLVSNPGDPNSTTAVAFAAFGLPGSFSLKQNYPNPFNPSTTITFTVPQNTSVLLRVYNSLGQPIRELVNDILQPGEYSLLWDGKNETGEIMGSGLYLARLESKGFEQTIRMLLMK